MTPKISIIIPVFNSNATIWRAVASACEQTWLNKEIIIIDDGSTENCLDVLQEFEGKFLYHRQSNQGAAAARNQGAELSSGEYLAFLDSDDTWHRQKLELQMQTIELGFDFDLCHSGGDQSRPDDNHKVVDISKIKVLTESDIYKNPFLGLPNVVMKKSVFVEVNGFDASLITAEDIDLYLKVAEKKKLMIHLQISLIVIALREGSLSRQTRSYLDFARVITTHAQSTDVSRTVIDELLITNYKNMARYCLWTDDRKGFRHAMQKLLSLKAYGALIKFGAKYPLVRIKWLLTAKKELPQQT